MHQPLRFCANLKWLFTELPYEQRFAAAAQAGFRAVEFASPYDFPLALTQRLLKEHGLQQILINTPAGKAGTANVSGRACHADSVAAFRDDFRLALEYASGLDCPIIHLQPGILPPGADRARAQATLEENVSWAAAEACQAQITVVLEAINQHDIPGYFYSKQQESLAVAQSVQADNVGLLFDIYHCQRSEGDVVWRMRELMPFIRHIQVADAPGRNEPGSGELAWHYIFAELEKLNYPGWIGCEYRPLAATREGLGWAEKYLKAD